MTKREIMKDKKVPQVRYWMPAAFFIMGVISLVMLIAIYRISEGLRMNFAFADAIETTMIRATSSHLLLEQWLAGDRTVDIRKVWRDLDDAVRLTTVIVKGGESEHGMILTPLKDPRLQGRVEELGTLLTRFKAMAQQRHLEPKGSPAISLMDRQIDATFAEFQDKSYSVEIVFEQKQIVYQARSRRLFAGILLVWALVIVATTAGLRNRERRKREAEAALRESEERFRTTLQHSSITVFNQDRDLRYTWVYNPQFVRTPEEVVGKTDAEIFPPDKAARLSEIKRRVIETGRRAHEEFVFTKSEGTFYLDLTIEALRDSTGTISGITCVAVNVTSLKRSEEELRRSTTLFQTLARVSPVGIFRADAEGNCVYVNERWCEIAGIPPEEALGRGWAGAIHADDRERVLAEWYSRVKDNHPFALEYRFQRPDGATSWVVGQAMAEPAGTLGKGGYVGAVTDISARKFVEQELKRHQERLQELVRERTEKLLSANALLQQEVSERKLGEEKLLKNEERYRSLVSATSQVVWTTNAGGQVTEDIPDWRAFTGQSKEEIKGWGWIDAVHSEDREQVETKWRHAVETRRAYEFVYRVRRHDGEYRYLATRGVPVLEKDGTIREWVGTCTDITERKRAEDMLRESESRFRNLSREFHILLEAIPDALTLLSSDLKVLWGNRRSLAIAGGTVAGLTGQYCYTIWHNRSVPCNGCPVVRSFKTGGEEVARMESKMGRLWEIRAFPVFDEGGKVNNVLTVASDITEKMGLEMEARRVAHLASLGEMAAGVAHEINNPINGIINYAQLLANRSPAGSRENDFATNIIKEGDRIASIVKSLLSFARAGKGEKNPASVREILLESLSLTATQMRKDGITLQVGVPADLPEIMAHPQQIQQVFLNIINNARYALNQKYQGIHKDKLLKIEGERVTVANQPSVRISFYDQGAGIPRDVLGKVMNPFFSTKPRGKGTGLGLSISHGIILDHGGELSVESAEGSFTRVLIQLPAREDEKNVKNPHS